MHLLLSSYGITAQSFAVRVLFYILRIINESAISVHMLASIFCSQNLIAIIIMAFELKRIYNLHQLFGRLILHLLLTSTIAAFFSHFIVALSAE